MAPQDARLHPREECGSPDVALPPQAQVQPQHDGARGRELHPEGHSELLPQQQASPRPCPRLPCPPPGVQGALSGATPGPGDRTHCPETPGPVGWVRSFGCCGGCDLRGPASVTLGGTGSRGCDVGGGLEVSRLNNGVAHGGRRTGVSGSRACGLGLPRALGGQGAERGSGSAQWGGLAGSTGVVALPCAGRGRTDPQPGLSS